MCTHESECWCGIPGHEDRSNLSWTPNRRIVQALDDAFHKAFQTIQPSGKKFYLAVDVSDSMSQPVLGSRYVSIEYKLFFLRSYHFRFSLIVLFWFVLILF
jgi:hypothetical protein